VINGRLNRVELRICILYDLRTLNVRFCRRPATGERKR
jgi:hypothetical protein